MTHEHNMSLMALAAIVCTVGSYLSVMLAQRTLRAPKGRREMQKALFALIGGTTVWSTHFIAMLAYEPDVPHGYDPALTVVSLLLAIIGMWVVLWLLLQTARLPQILLSGWLLGHTITVMHYTGMAAYQVPGEFVWDFGRVALSVTLSCVFGSIAVHRIIYPVTRYCWMFGKLFLILAICALHFTAMSAVEVVPNPLAVSPAEYVSDPVLGWVIFGVTTAIFLVGFASMHVEIQTERESLRAMQHTLKHDYLTGLPNRFWLTARLNDMAKDGTDRCAVLTLDIDGFKAINDLHGQAVGDAVLSKMAQLIQSCLGPGEEIVRTGGNEFVAIKSEPEAMAQAMDFAARLHVATQQPIAVDQLSLRVGVSIGLAANISATVGPQDLLQRSAIAMSHAKDDPHRPICAYDQEMHAAYRDRIKMTDDLAHAAALGQLHLVYQFQNAAATGQVIGVEALLRWTHPEQGEIKPDTFIPLAEETGLIRAIGHWVLHQACLEAATWEIPLTVAVNVAPQQIAQTNFLADVAGILKETGLDPNRLELEVTEASVIDDPGNVLEVMCSLRALGVKIAMDDFGTGYSSLATLQSFPFDKIKIDKSFVRDVHLDEQRAAIVRAVMLLGSAMNVSVLAEGVETKEELAFLTDLQCGGVQGFLFGRPFRSEDLLRWMQTPQAGIAC